MKRFLALTGTLLLCCGMATSSASADVLHASPEQLLREADLFQGSDATVDSALIQAAEQIRGRNHEEAIRALQALARQHAGDERVWFVLAVAQSGRCRYAQALEAADRCVVIRPRWPKGHWLRGTFLAVLSRLEEAARAYDAAVEAAPMEVGNYLQRGVFLVRYRSASPEGLRAGARDLTKALDLGGPPETVHGFLGLAYRRLGEPVRAEKHLLQVLEIQPLHLDAVSELVALYDERGQRDRAERALAPLRKRASSLAPTEAGLLSLIEARHAQAGGAGPQVVEKHFRAAVELRPEDVSGRLEYARWLESVDRNAATIPVLKAGLERQPEEPHLAAQLAWALADASQDLPEARHWLAVARRRDAKDPYLADTEAWIEYRQGNYRAALTALQPSLPHAEATPEIAYHAGAIHAKLGDRTQAVAFLRRSLQSGRGFNGRDHARGLLERLQ